MAERYGLGSTEDSNQDLRKEYYNWKNKQEQEYQNFINGNGAIEINGEKYYKNGSIIPENIMKDTLGLQDVQSKKEGELVTAANGAKYLKTRAGWVSVRK